MAKRLTDDILRWTLEVNGNPAQKELNDVEQSTHKLKKSNKELRVEMQKLIANGKKNTDEYKKLDAQYKKNNATIKVNDARMNKLRKEIGINALTAKQLRQEYRRLKTQMDSTTPGTEKWHKLNNEMNAVKKRMGQVNGVSKKQNAIFGQMKALLPALGIGAFVAGLRSIWNSARQVRREFEKYEAVLKVALGSNSAARESMKMIQDFAAKTPYSVSELTDSFVKLTNYGMKPNQEMMRQYGDIAASVGKSFDQFAEAAADASQFEFERLKEFGIRASSQGDKIVFTFRGQKTEIDKTSDAVKNYLSSLGDYEGIAGSMAAIAKTETGLISNLGDSWERLMNTMGKRSSGVFKSLVSGVTDIVNSFNEWMEIPVEDELRAQQREVNLLINSIVSLDEEDKVRSKLITELNTKYPDLLGNVDKEKVKNEDLLKVKYLYNQQIRESIKLSIIEEKVNKLKGEAKELLADEMQAIEVINRIYYDRVENAKEGATIEEQITAIKEGQLKVYRSETNAYVTRETIEEGLRKQALAYEEIKKKKKEQGLELTNQIADKEKSIVEIQEKLNTLLEKNNDKKKEANEENEPEPVSLEEWMKLHADEFENWQQARDVYYMNQRIYEQEKLAEEKRIMEDYKKALDEEFALEEEEEADDFSPELSRAGKQAFLTKKYELAQAKETAEGKKAILKQQLDENIISRKEYADKVKAIDKQLYISQVSAAASTMGNIASLFAEKTGAYKLFASAEATMATYLAATNMIDPKIGGPPPLNYINMAAVIVKGLMNVAKINGVGVDQAYSGRYPVLGAQDGKTYQAGVKTNARTGLLRQPTLLAGELPEYIIDPQTTQRLLDERPDIINTIREFAGKEVVRSTVSDQQFKTKENEKDSTIILSSSSIKKIEKDHPGTIKEINSIAGKEIITNNILAEKENSERLIQITSDTVERLVTNNSELLNTIKQYVEKENLKESIQEKQNIVIDKKTFSTLQKETPQLITEVNKMIIQQAYSGKYPVTGAQDGKTYQAGVKTNARTGLLRQPTLLAGELPEYIIDPQTTATLIKERPDVINTIRMYAGVPQAAAGKYPVSTKEIHTTEKSVRDPELVKALQDNAAVMRKFMETPIRAHLAADYDYIKEHNDIMDKYNDTLRDVNMS